MADRHEPYDELVSLNGLPSSRPIGLNSAMQALRRQNKTPFELFEEMQKRLKEMSNEEFMKLYDENKTAIERIREQQGVNLSSYASTQISGAQRTFAQLARAPKDGSMKMLERVNLCLMIDQYYQRSTPAVMPRPAPLAPEPSPPQANLANVKPCGPNMQSIISHSIKSVIEGQNGRNPLLQSSAGPKPVRLRKFYPPSGHEIDMDSLFEGPAADEEPRCGRLVPSSLTLTASRPQEPQNHRLGSLDLRNISGRSQPSSNAGLAAIARSEQQPSYKGGSKQTRPTALGAKGLIAAFVHKDQRSRGMPSVGIQERMDRPLSAPAAAGGGGGSRRERKAQSAAKAPVEGSNRDQAIAIESSDEEGEGKEKETKMAGHRHNTRRSSENVLLSKSSLENEPMPDSKRYEGYRCVYPPLQPEKKLDGEVQEVTLLAEGEGGEARASSHAGASTSAPSPPHPSTAAAATAAGNMKGKKKKKEKRRVVEVMAKDFERLEPLEFLNDTCIDFYLRYIEENLSPSMKQRCYFFNSFFYKKLAEKVVKGKGQVSSIQVTSAGGRVDHCDLDFLEEEEDSHLPTNQRAKHAAEKHRVNHERVKNWTKGVDLFSKDFIFIPIHAGLHWSLVIICHPGGVTSGRSPVIMHLDSMGNGHPSASIFTHLRYYLHNEWLRKKGDDPASVPATYKSAKGLSMDFLGPKNGGKDIEGSLQLVSIRLKFIPQQDNHCDCGLFVLSFIEFFCHAQPKSIDGDAVKQLNSTLQRERTIALEMLSAGLGDSDHLDFLDQKWIDPINTGHLRHFIKRLMLGLMHDQALEALDVARAKEYEKRKSEAEKARGSQGEGGGGEGEFVFPPLSPLEVPPVIAMMKAAIEEFERQPPSSRYLPPGQYMQEKKSGDLERALEASRQVESEQIGATMTRRRHKTVIDSDKEEEVKAEEKKKKNKARGNANELKMLLTSDDESETMKKVKSRIVARLDQNALSRDKWVVDIASDDVQPASPALKPHSKSVDVSSPPDGDDDVDASRGSKRRNEGPRGIQARRQKVKSSGDDHHGFGVNKVDKSNGHRAAAAASAVHEEEDDGLEILGVSERKENERADYSSKLNLELPDDGGGPMDAMGEEEGDLIDADVILDTQQEEEEEEVRGRESKRQREGESDPEEVLRVKKMSLHGCAGPFDSMADEYLSATEQTKVAQRKKNQSSEDEDFASTSLPPLPHQHLPFASVLDGVNSLLEYPRREKRQIPDGQIVIDEDEEVEAEVTEVSKDQQNKKRAQQKVKVDQKEKRSEKRQSSGRGQGRGRGKKGKEQNDSDQELRRRDEFAAGGVIGGGKYGAGAVVDKGGGAMDEEVDPIYDSPDV